jgi:pyrroloquinoline quinone biosynthesis protein B
MACAAGKRKLREVLMKLVILKGGSDAVRHGHAPTRGRASSHSPGALALSDGGQRWLLINVTPAVGDQLATDARLLRHEGLVDSRVRAVVLTDAQVDHVTGLLALRDGVPIHLYATPAVFEELTHSLPILPLLEDYCGVHWHVIPVAGECRETAFRVEGHPGLEFTALATDGPLPAHVSHTHTPVVGETIALAVRDRRSGRRLFCCGSVAEAGMDALAWMQDADCVVFGDDLDRHPSDSEFEADPDALSLLAGSRASRKVMMALPEPLDAAETELLTRQGIELARDRGEIEV